MADPGDPFRIDPEKTVIRPMPVRPSVARPVPRPATGTAVEDISLSEIIPAGANPILAAASPLLALAVRVRGSATQPDIAVLRDQMLQHLKLFQDRLRAAGIAARTTQIAHRSICALLDDIVLNTPWGAHSAWRSATLFSVFHGQVTGGDWFFDALKQLLSEPRGNADILEVMYSCLSLGFEGRLRMQANGAAELARVREFCTPQSDRSAASSNANSPHIGRAFRRPTSRCRAGYLCGCTPPLQPRSSRWYLSD